LRIDFARQFIDSFLDRRSHPPFACVSFNDKRNRWPNEASCLFVRCLKPHDYDGELRAG
jgi:hypothetical protein